MTQPLPGDQPLPFYPPIPDQTPSAAEIEEGLYRRLIALRESNKDGLTQLLSRGRTLNPIQMLHAQIDSLATILLDSDERLHYDLAVEEALARMIELANAEATREELLGGPAGPPAASGLIVPGH